MVNIGSTGVRRPRGALRGLWLSLFAAVVSSVHAAAQESDATTAAPVTSSAPRVSVPQPVPATPIQERPGQTESPAPEAPALHSEAADAGSTEEVPADVSQAEPERTAPIPNQVDPIERPPEVGPVKPPASAATGPEPALTAPGRQPTRPLEMYASTSQSIGATVRAQPEEALSVDDVGATSERMGRDDAEPRFRIGLGRLYGLHAHRARVVDGSDQMDTYSSQLNLASASTTPVAGMPLQQTSSIPRLFLDYAPVPHTTVGLTAGYAVTNNRADIEGETGSVTTDVPSQSSFLIGIRAGYTRELLPWLELWLSAGVGFTQQNAVLQMVGGDRTFSLTAVNLGLEPQLVVKVLPGIGIVAQPYLEGSVAAALETEDRQGKQSFEYGEVSGGLTMGLVILL